MPGGIVPAKQVVLIVDSVLVSEDPGVLKDPEGNLQEATVRASPTVYL